MAQGVPAEAMNSLPSTTVRVLEGLPSIDGKKVAVRPAPHMPHNAYSNTAAVLYSTAILPLPCTHRTIAGHAAKMQETRVKAPMQ